MEKGSVDAVIAVVSGKGLFIGFFTCVGSSLYGNWTFPLVGLLLGHDCSEQTRVTGAIPSLHKEPQDRGQGARLSLGGA